MTIDAKFRSAIFELNTLDLRNVKSFMNIYTKCTFKTVIVHEHHKRNHFKPAKYWNFLKTHSVCNIYRELKLHFFL